MATADPKDIRRARRIVIVSRSDGISGVSLGVLAVVVSLAIGDVPAALASLGICAAGALEITGSFRAARRDAAAPRWLVGAIALSLTSVLALLLRCTVALSPATVLTWMPESSRETVLLLYPGPGEAEEWLRVGLRFTFGLVALVAALFEAGMAVFHAASRGVFLRLSTATPPRA